MRKILLIPLIFLLIVGSSGSVLAQTESILITQSSDRNDVVFDGKWTFLDEWKETSFDEFSFDDKTKIVFRTAHQDDFIYFFIDSISDFKPDKGSDKALICIDGNNDKTSLPQQDDYCFGVALGNNNGFVLQGGSQPRRSPRRKTLEHTRH